MWKQTLEPKQNPSKRVCQNCYWFDFKPNHKPRTRSCMYPDAIEMDQSVIVIPSPSGEQKIGKNQCGMWRDCGLLELGILKNLV